MNGFVSEFLVVRGAWPVFTGLTLIAMLGLLITGTYILKGIRATLRTVQHARRDYHLEIDVREFPSPLPR
ncbi:MAG: hypothetical protein U0703_11090 [Anaerolineae bacterium]